MKLVRMLACLLPLLLCACNRNANQPQAQVLAPPIEETLPPPPDTPPTNLPATVIAIPKTKTPVVVQEQPKPAPHHRKTKPPAPAPTTATGQPPTPVSADPAPAEVSAIGQLSATTEPPSTKREAEDMISEAEKGLSGINRTLNETDEKTSTQIREFLKQARTALASGDVDGAKTLAKKAKALLGELSQ